MDKGVEGRPCCQDDGKGFHHRRAGDGRLTRWERRKPLNSTVASLELEGKNWKKWKERRKSVYKEFSPQGGRVDLIVRSRLSVLSDLSVCAVPAVKSAAFLLYQGGETIRRLRTKNDKSCNRQYLINVVSPFFFHFQKNGTVFSRVYNYWDLSFAYWAIVLGHLLFSGICMYWGVKR